MKHILILGAKSDIARSIAEIYAENGYHLILAGRIVSSLMGFKSSLEKKYNVSVQLEEFDVLDYDRHQSFYNGLQTKPYGIICAIGYLGDQSRAEQNSVEAKCIIDTNYTGCVHILTICTSFLENLEEGFIVGISSVAGDRGRKKNYFYGSSKAGFTAYLSGLRARLSKKGIHVLTVKPGFIYTKMTAHVELPKLLTTTPQKLAFSVFKAQQNKKNVIYVKWIWRYIMWVIRWIPEFIFKKMNL
ncbi:SDR family oxidoreductase [Aquimarina sp. M1]